MCKHHSRRTPSWSRRTACSNSSINLPRAEGRMKWVPNKKLHFEVAIIKAIQSLGQATLDEVIEKLSQLRDGKSVLTKAICHLRCRRAAIAGEKGRCHRLCSISAVSDSGYNRARRAWPKHHPTRMNCGKRFSLKIPAQKAFVRNSAAAAHVLGIEGRNFQLGFAPGDKAMMDILGPKPTANFLKHCSMRSPERTGV